MANNQSWTVVEFTDDGTVEAVPSSWIEQNGCYWPPLVSNKLAHAIKNCEAPKENWSRHCIKVYRNATFDEYAKAREKAKLAEETSDLQSEIEANNKRKRKQNKRFLDNDDSSDELEFISLPPPPKIQRNEELATCMNISPILEPNVITEIPIVDHQLFIENLQPKATTSTQMETVESQLKNIIGQQHVLRCLLTDVLSRVEKIEINSLAKNQTSGDDKASVFQQEIVFPINSAEEFEKLDAYLEDDKNSKNTILELANIGGANNYNFIKRVMANILTDEFAKEYSWFGKKGKKKFYNTKIAKVIVDAAEQSNKVAKDRKETEVSIQSWLRRAAERCKHTVKNL